ncbi:hypothetical protein HO173_011364 [Letharia columbiana]|uniref:Uncharacterized protein n=1 Tax=Letharia columbiana TaxID=112416 RepID=A0A8H6FJM8_9LECA|nr:uncharacterized protein HO173_011364 [Letharia columbiana]KAF6229717.1 hypothetical protein HO173_011364 [Letharia columbiana]
MVVFVDLEDDVPDDPHADPNEPRGFSSLRKHHLGDRSTAEVTANGHDEHVEERPNPNINSFSAALGAYPIVTQLAHNVDLNTLDALSRTCRQIRANLLQYRTRLVQQTLRCENEFRDARSSESEKPGQKWHILGEAGHLVSGKVSACARDLVSDCRRCGRIVCRVRPIHFRLPFTPPGYHCVPPSYAKRPTPHRTAHPNPHPPRPSPPATAVSAPPASPPPSPSSPPPLAPARPASTSAPPAAPASQPRTRRTAACGRGARGSRPVTGAWGPGSGRGTRASSARGGGGVRGRWMWRWSLSAAAVGAGTGVMVV